MNIVLAGGTGFIGARLISELAGQGHRVVLLTRRPASASQNPMVTSAQWDGENPGSWCAFLDGADAVINLCGEGIATKPWTEKRKKEILESRIKPTAAIINAIEKAQRRPALLINASGAGFYGDYQTDRVSETAPAGKGFLAETCRQWESAAFKAEDLGVRVVVLRIGVVLEKEGGALAKMIPPFLFFAGGPLGPGTQFFPWIHRDDLINIILHALLKTDLSGPVNAVAPEGVTMAQFCKTLGKVLRRPSWAPVPAPVLKLLLGEMSELFLQGANIVPAKLMRSGFQFRYPELLPALTAAVENKKRTRP